jgi:hypothetical protein
MLGQFHVLNFQSKVIFYNNFRLVGLLVFIGVYLHFSKFSYIITTRLIVGKMLKQTDQ